MYKFTNGLVFYTKEDADKAIVAGYRLIEEKKETKENENSEVIDKPIEETDRKPKKSNRKD